MRILSLLLLLLVGGGVVALAVQNQHEATLTFFTYSLSTKIAWIVGAAYLLGMFSGWFVLGVLRRSIARVAEYPEDRPMQNRIL